jgi:hypothetical protein
MLVLFHLKDLQLRQHRETPFAAGAGYWAHNACTARPFL